MKRILLVLMIAGIFPALLRAEEFSLVTLQYPPYEYQDSEEGQVKGIATEIVRQAFARMGHTVKIRVLPWPRVLWMVEHGEADGFFTTYRTPERESWADYSNENLMPQVTSLFVQKGSGISYSGNLADLAAEPIGVVMSVSYGKKFDQAVQDRVLPHVLASIDGETNFRQLLTGRLRIVASNRLGARYILKRMGRAGDVEELAPPLESPASFLAFSKRKNLKTLRDAFDAALRQMKADGTWARLANAAE
jgi:polar amino acid transport system substrate-binding protein